MRQRVWAIPCCCLLWQASAASRVELKIQLGHSDSVTSVAISPDSRVVLTTGDITARLWDPESGREIRSFVGHTRKVTSAAFAPDGRTIVTGSQDGTARIWDVASGREIQRFGKPPDEISSVAFSPDGRRVAIGRFSIPSVLVLDVASGRELLQLVPHGAASSSVSFSRDGSVILNAYACFAMFWNAATGEEIKAIRDNGTSDDFKEVQAAAFSPDARTLATASRGSLHLWNPVTGATLHQFDINAMSLAFSPDSQSLLVGGERGAILLDVRSGREIRSFTVTTGRQVQVTAVAFSADGRLALAGSLYPVAVLWDASSGREITRFEGRQPPVLGAVVTPDGRSVLAATGEPDVLQWDLDTGREARRLPGNKHMLLSVGTSADGRLIAGSGYAQAPNDQPFDLWDAATGKLVQAPAGSNPIVTALALSPNGRYLLANPDDGGDMHHAALWDLSTRKQLWQIDRKGSLIQALAFSPDGKLALVGGNDGSALLREVSTGKEVRRFEVKEGADSRPILGIAFSRDGKLIATANPNALEGSVLDTHHGFATVIGVDTGRELRRFLADGGGGSAVAFSPDQRQVITVDGDSAQIWDIASGRLLHRLDGHAGKVMSTAFSPDGSWILTCALDGTTRIWDAATGRPMAVLVSFRGGGWAVVDPDGRYDASDPDNSPGLHFVAGNDIIELNQLKARFFTPGLLARIWRGERLPEIAGSLKDVKLVPGVEVEPPAPGSMEATVRLTNRGGGIGKVTLKVNGRELPTATQGVTPDAKAKSAEVRLNLEGATLAPTGKNVIEVVAENGDGVISSRALIHEWVREPPKQTKDPNLFAIVVGVSSYDNASLDLRYPAKDATDFGHALELAARGLFGKERTHVAVLSSGGTEEPTKENIRRAFERVAKEALGSDLLVVYFAGHGFAPANEHDQYYYLSKEGRSTDIVRDAGLRAVSAVSSTELKEWLGRTNMPLKQVVVLDTCAAGAAFGDMVKLAERRELSPDQVRAIELLKDSTGSWILMGSAADAVSYEATRYAQGLLTYALLDGMHGAALEEDRVEVSKLFGFAQRQVEALARGIGGIQRPVLSAPKGQTFPIGLLKDEDRRQIHLATLKPQLLRARLLDENDLDSLKLEPALRAELRGASLPVTRGNDQQDPQIVYLDSVVDEVPDALIPQIRYAVAGDKVKIRLRLLQNGKPVAERNLVLPKREAGQLSRALLPAIVAESVRVK